MSHAALWRPVQFRMEKHPAWQKNLHGGKISRVQ
jgi:hypothetical protein